MGRALAAGLLAIMCLFSQPTADRAADTGTSTTPKLKDTLEKGLKARLPSEFAFIRTVIEKVDDGTLPRSVVESTFLWARRKPQHPFEYFQQGLKVRAEKLGVTL
jgi:hypothetical protein